MDGDTTIPFRPVNVRWDRERHCAERRGLMEMGLASVEGVLNAFPWWAWIAIVAVVGETVRQVVKMNHKHRERIEMIRQGMDPRDHDRG